MAASGNIRELFQNIFVDLSWIESHLHFFSCGSTIIAWFAHLTYCDFLRSLTTKNVIQSYLPRDIFLWSCPVGHSVATSHPCVNPDREMLLTWNLAQLYFAMLEKNGGKKFQHCTYGDDGVTNYVNFFEKLCEKWLKCFFSFLKLTLWQLEKRFSRSFFNFWKSR